MLIAEGGEVVVAPDVNSLLLVLAIVEWRLLEVSRGLVRLDMWLDAAITLQETQE